MTPFRIMPAVIVLLAAAPAAASGWTGWPAFYRSFAVEPPPVREAKLPGIHKVPDITLKRGITGAPPKTETTPKPKSSLDSLPAAPRAVQGWDPKEKKAILGEATHRGVRFQQGRVPLDDMPDPPAPPRFARATPPSTLAIQPPVLDDRKNTQLIDDLVKPSGALPPAGLAPKPSVALPGTGTRFTGQYRVNGTTHKLR
jgi:hypothetical protein